METKKYVVTWKLERQEPAPCPDRQPDPYTGQFSSLSCAVYHYRTVTEEKIKSFETREEALDFIKNAPSSCSDFALLAH